MTGTELKGGDKLPSRFNKFVQQVDDDSIVQPVGYTRYSTKTQKTSTERQVTSILEHANQFPNWRPPIIFSDEGVPGTTISRVKFDAMFEYCRDHPGTPIIIENMSRVARDGRAYQEFFLRRRETKAITHLVGWGELDELFEGFLQTFASYEYRNLITTMRGGRSQAAAKGKKVSNLRFGVSADENNDIVFDPDYAKPIIMMFKCAALGMKPKQICDHLLENGMRGPRKDGSWKGRMITDIIRDPIFAGRYVFNPQVLDWERPPQEMPSLLLDDVHYDEIDKG